MNSSARRTKLFESEAEAREFVAGLGLGRIGLSGEGVRYFDETDSTNTEARRLAELGASGGTVVLAEYQARGRGRLGRRWVCPSRAGLLVSVLVDHAPFTERGGPGLPWLTAAGALAMARAAGDACAGDVLIEWPNDLVAPVHDNEHDGDTENGSSTALADQRDPDRSGRSPCLRVSSEAGGVRSVLGRVRKLGGVLVEGGRSDAHSSRGSGLVVLGVGLNVDVRTDEFPPELARTAGSLLTVFGTAPDRREVLAGFLCGLERRSEARSELARELSERSATLGREVEVVTVGSDGIGSREVGRATAFDERMRLVVEFPGGRLATVASSGLDS